jgi:hypothetical protein
MKGSAHSDTCQLDNCDKIVSTGQTESSIYCHMHECGTPGCIKKE